MKSPKTLAGSIAVLLFALVILGFGISPVSASAGSWPSGNSTAIHGHWGGQHFTPNSTQQYTMTESFITRLQSQGVDVSAVQAALANNDTATVKSWLKSYFEAHPGAFGNTTHMQRGHGFAVNATVQQAHLQSFITRLQSQGVDVSGIQTALANNDTATAKSWLTSYFTTHQGAHSNSTRPQWRMWNSTATQSS